MEAADLYEIYLGCLDETYVVYIIKFNPIFLHANSTAVGTNYRVNTIKRVKIKENNTYM
jgi:hypothetical protein